MSEMLYENLSENEMQSLAQNFSKTLRTGDVVLFYGDLGAGKTSFARAIIQALCTSDTTVPSPTFTLIQTYETIDCLSIDHYDLYRLSEKEAEDDIINLGWEDSLNDCITLVEWPIRLGTLKPQKTIDITITIPQNDPKTRTVQIKDNKHT